MNNQSEEKVKKLLLTKLQNPEFKNSLSKEELLGIEKLFDIFPDLKTFYFSQDIINASQNEIVLDEIKIDNKIYYTDMHGGIWDEKSELVGVSKKPGEYYFFTKNYNLEKNANFFINQ
ncbi:hypothetical protein Indivirus_3_46 [Indivirus ILV1]|uniref:Uncharacterized protein n=1 Tax=Indivirus ILV1 TaxID=1977633 RepID=A0A1V0SDK8_9VIRU|nr:hypothetical protein Indivirus_3_46 [Indivirus ILV1]